MLLWGIGMMFRWLKDGCQPCSLSRVLIGYCSSPRTGVPVGLVHQSIQGSGGTKGASRHYTTYNASAKPLLLWRSHVWTGSAAEAKLMQLLQKDATDQIFPFFFFQNWTFHAICWRCLTENDDVLVSPGLNTSSSCLVSHAVLVNPVLMCPSKAFHECVVV